MQNQGKANTLNTFFLTRYYKNNVDHTKFQPTWISHPHYLDQNIHLFDLLSSVWCLKENIFVMERYTAQGGKPQDEVSYVSEPNF